MLEFEKVRRNSECKLKEFKYDLLSNGQKSNFKMMQAIYFLEEHGDQEDKPQGRCQTLVNQKEGTEDEDQSNSMSRHSGRSQKRDD